VWTRGRRDLAGRHLEQDRFSLTRWHRPNHSAAVVAHHVLFIASRLRDQEAGTFRVTMILVRDKRPGNRFAFHLVSLSPGVRQYSILSDAELIHVPPVAGRDATVARRPNATNTHCPAQLGLANIACWPYCSSSPSAVNRIRGSAIPSQNAYRLLIKPPH
jgi:hypothetical protein